MTYEEAIKLLRTLAARTEEPSPKAAARMRAAIGAIERDHEAKLNRAKVLEAALEHAQRGTSPIEDPPSTTYRAVPEEGKNR